jgi:hypothetical protein
VRGHVEEAVGISWSNTVDVRGQSVVVAGVRTRSDGIAMVMVGGVINGRYTRKCW